LDKTTTNYAGQLVLAGIPSSAFR